MSVNKVGQLLDAAEERLKSYKKLFQAVERGGDVDTTDLWALQRIKDELIGNMIAPLVELLHDPSTKPDTRKRIAGLLNRIEVAATTEGKHGLQDPGELAIKVILANPRAHEQRGIIEAQTGEYE